ncbi:MAG TPA: phosphoglycerate dehydrogenase [Rhodanobacteraceae bacterium]
MKTSFPKKDIRVLLLEGVSQTAVDGFHAAGYTNVEYHTKALPHDELIERIAEAHIIGLRSRTYLTPEVLAHARRLMAIGCFCIGTNQVDLDVARDAGIPVFNAPYSNTRSVAELVVAEAVMLKRGVPYRNAASHRGEWTKSATDSYEVRGKTLGIIGYGHIGTQVGVLAEAMGMNVIYYDIVPQLQLGNAKPVATLKDLLAQSDIVTLHVPRTPQTDNMIGADEIAQMRDGAMLINASRGTVVDIPALAAALDSGHIGGAAIDVHPVEPKGKDDPFVSPLIGKQNVILTPHVGGSTQEAQSNIGREVSAKLIHYSDNGSTLSAVNFPEVVLPAHPSSRRLLHIHRNQPGILSRINDLFSRAAVNIEGQFLRTSPEVGYVVIDIDAPEEQVLQLREQMAAIDGTLRTRVLY